MLFISKFATRHRTWVPNENAYSFIFYFSYRIYRYFCKCFDSIQQMCHGQCQIWCKGISLHVHLYVLRRYITRWWFNFAYLFVSINKVVYRLFSVDKLSPNCLAYWTYIQLIQHDLYHNQVISRLLKMLFPKTITLIYIINLHYLFFLQNSQ